MKLSSPHIHPSARHGLRTVIQRERLLIQSLLLLVLMFGIGWALTSRDVVPEFSDAATVEEKKADFFAYLRPHVIEVNAKVLSDRERLQELISTDGSINLLDHFFLRRLRLLYLNQEADPQDLHGLLNKVDIIPNSLALIQAAKESGWGSSRFARNGYNFFGQQCFVRGCGFTPKNRSRGRSHEVAKFRSTRDAVRAYIHNLNTHIRYASFREKRATLRRDGQPLKGEALAIGLDGYSERGYDYVTEIQAMIRANNLE
ncbi:MAG: hypothetical protein GKR90_01710 [Pseudomonadales bacterium]|nr:hypothetical protein [Pseudomonadales bacterium]